MFGRAWPLRAPVRAGIVPSWSQLLGDTEVPCTVSSVPCFFLDFDGTSIVFAIVYGFCASICEKRVKPHFFMGNLLQCHPELNHYLPFVCACQNIFNFSASFWSFLDINS